MHIKVIGGLEEINPNNDNVDVHVYLDDGRIYSLLMATPSNLYWCMDNGATDYFFGMPPVFVKMLTPDNIDRAIKALVEEDGGRWLHVYGSLQTED
ncbi:MAG: hypothetical protein ABI995_07085 [Acidobacteriota bacterium]